MVNVIVQQCLMSVRLSLNNYTLGTTALYQVFLLNFSQPIGC